MVGNKPPKRGVTTRRQSVSGDLAKPVVAKPTFSSGKTARKALPAIRGKLGGFDGTKSLPVDVLAKGLQQAALGDGPALRPVRCVISCHTPHGVRVPL